MAMDRTSCASPWARSMTGPMTGPAAAAGAGRDGARDEARSGASGGADGDERERLRDPVHAGDARRVGACAEQGRLPQGGHAAIADDEIERQDQKRDGDDPREQGQVVRKQPIAGSAGRDDQQTPYTVA